MEASHITCEEFVIYTKQFKNHPSRFNWIQQLFISINSQHVLAQLAIIRLARMEDKYAV